MLLILIISAVAALSSGDAYGLECTTRLNNCAGGETAIFRFNNTSPLFSGGHAAIWNQTGYVNVICCSQPGDVLYSECNHLGSDIVLNLTSANNSHVQLKAANPSSNSYGTSVCLAAQSTAAFDCQSTLTPPFDCAAKYGADYKCIASVNETNAAFWRTNAHVGDCNAYPEKICCKAGPPVFSIAPPIITADSPGEIRVLLGGQGRMILKIRNPLDKDDKIEVISTGNPVKLHNWIWFEGHRYDENKNKIVLELGPGEERAIAIEIYGGEILPGSISITAKSTRTGLESSLSPSQSVSIVYSEDGMNVKTPDLSWPGFAVLAVIGALLV